MKDLTTPMGNAFDVSVLDYDLWYDAEGKSIYKSELKCVGSLVGKDKPILEVGVGTGRFAMHFLPAFGVDPAIKALKLAKTRGIKVANAVGERLPFKDCSFNCLLIIATLCFVESPIDALREANRVLKNNGRIIIGFIPAGSPWGVLYEGKKQKGHPIYSKAKFYTFKEVEGFLKESGFEIVRVKSTLLQGPEEMRRIESCLEGYARGAGFVCVEAKKTA